MTGLGRLQETDGGNHELPPAGDDNLLKMSCTKIGSHEDTVVEC